MEDDTDIYEDLPIIEIKSDENFVANQTESNCRERECAELNERITELTVKLENFQKLNENLEVNLASLLKTAKAEITRKDRMIEDLRKQLDDVMFRRGAYGKTNSRVCKPTFVDNVATPPNWQKTGQNFVSPNQSRRDSTEADSLYNPTNSSNPTKSTLTPLTVYGERLLKRIAEEQSMEKRGKQAGRFCCNNSSISTIDGYVIESDKENGSVTDVTTSCTKEMQLSMVKEYSEREEFATTDFLVGEDSEIDSNSRFQRTPTIDANTMDIAEVRRNDDRERTMSRKHIKKYEIRERATKLKNNKMREDLNDVFDYKHDCTKTKRFESLEKFSEPRYITYSHTEHSRYWYTEQQGKKRSHRSFTDKAGTSQDDTDEHISKRHCRSVERSSSTMDDYRSSSVERYRMKQREDGHAGEMWGDRRSRGRNSSCESSKEEKYSRNKFNQYIGYRERSVRRYDVGSNSTDGSKAAKREFRDSRNTEKSEKSVRSTSKRSDRYEDCESQFQERLKSVDRVVRRDKSTKQHDDYTKYSSHGKFDREKLTDRTRHSETLKSEKISETNKHFERIDRCGFTKNDETPSTTKVSDSSQKHQLDRNKDLKSADVNDVALDPGNRPSNKKERERSKDRWTNGDHKSESYLISVEIANTNIVGSNDATANIDNNESAENVENIEKFIRNYNADSDHFENSLDERDDTSNTAKEHASTMNDIFENKINLKEQCDTVRTNGAESVKTDTKLGSKHVSRKVSLDSAQNGAKENETTAVVTHVPNAKISTAQNNSTLRETYQMLESNSIDSTDDKPSINSNIKATNTNISSNINSDGNGNGNDNREGKDNSRICGTRIFEDSVIDKINSSCNDGVINVATGNDDDDQSHNQHGHREHKKHSNVNVYKKSIENDRNTIKDEEQTNKGLASENLMVKLDKRLENEEGQVKKETKEYDKAVIVEVSRETEKSPINCDSINGKNTPTKLHGKIVVFARRKKPVCLANNNANMTVLINNSHNLNNN
ncbi:FLICE-associated huge protein [Megalopta genalis]|uniref:FLICE-associated huge protein n=1 Tax=Megalopta genalis TaxID=115081 RepID=UPI003FD2E3C6